MNLLAILNLYQYLYVFLNFFFKTKIFFYLKNLNIFLNIIHIHLFANIAKNKISFIDNDKKMIYGIVFLLFKHLNMKNKPVSIF